MRLASEPPAMETYRVSRAVNTPRNNREDLLLQVEGGRAEPGSTAPVQSIGMVCCEAVDPHFTGPRVVPTPGVHS